MQEGGGGEMQVLLSILAEGEEQARRLLLHDGDGKECCRAVAGQLGRTLGKAMAVAKAIQAAGGAASAGTDDRSDSPRSADESSAAQVQVQERQSVCKRRKGLPKWTEKFRIPDTNLEYTPDDGFSWRKYGQKDILGAKFPRGYYRCTYRTAQGCPATRQVQRSDADLAVFDVTYQGAHTCHQINQRHPVPVPVPAPHPPPSAHAHGGIHPPPPPQNPDLQLLATFKDGLKVETDHGPPAPTSSFQIHGLHHGASFPPFPYAAAAAGFPSSPGFVSPGPATAPAAAGGSGYFSSAASELGAVVSAATSSAAAAVDPAGGFEDYPLFQYDEYHQLQQDDLDPDLQFPAMFGGHPSASSSSPGQQQ